MPGAPSSVLRIIHFAFDTAHHVLGTSVSDSDRSSHDSVTVLHRPQEEEVLPQKAEELPPLAVEVWSLNLLVGRSVELSQKHRTCAWMFICRKGLPTSR